MQCTTVLHCCQVNVREGFSVPLGLRGTVIRVQQAAKLEDSLYDVLFDQPFIGGLGLRCSAGRGYRMPGSALINLSYREQVLGCLQCTELNRAVLQGRAGGSGGRGKEAGEKVKPRAVVNPWYEGREEGREQSGSGGRPGRGRGHHQEPRKEQKGKVVGGGFPPPPRVSAPVPTPPHPVKILQRPTKGVKQETGKAEGNFVDIWAALAGGAAPVPAPSPAPSPAPGSVADMETNLKAMLNISSTAEPPPKFTIGGAQFPVPGVGAEAGNSCRTLAAHLARNGRGPPRYDFISEPGGSGLVAAQVSLEDGSLHHSPAPAATREEAGEAAARAALISLGVGEVGGVAGRGRGRGRGRKQHRDTESSQFQPWAEYQPGAVAPALPQEPRQARDNRHLAGTDQMDIRYRDQELPATTAAKPAFVPLQVSKSKLKAAKSREKEESQSREASAPPEEPKFTIGGGGQEVGRGADTEDGGASKEQTPVRAGKAVAPRRKPRIAANFGAPPPSQ